MWTLHDKRTNEKSFELLTLQRPKYPSEIGSRRHGERVEEQRNNVYRKKRIRTKHTNPHEVTDVFII